MQLELIKKGCNILRPDKKNTDLSNYRYFIYEIELNDEIKDKFGIDKKLSSIEISKGSSSEVINGELKKKSDNTLWTSLEFIDDKGNFSTYHKLEEFINTKDEYTSENVLKTINKISKKQYKTILEIEV